MTKQNIQFQLTSTTRPPENTTQTLQKASSKPLKQHSKTRLATVIITCCHFCTYVGMKRRTKYSLTLGIGSTVFGAKIQTTISTRIFTGAEQVGVDDVCCY